MPPKQPLDKLTWQWAESTDPENVTLEHIKTAYRLNLKPCELGACRRQCKGNPFCINCIGERVWFGEIEDTSWHDIQDPEEERRKPGMFVGLKNLGATCYVNTFLQLWFHNDTVKQGINQWREPGMENIMDDNWKPSSACSHLQVVFGLLEMSKRQYIDPSDFIQHLGLDAGQQQDAQEFSKLFLSVLEQSLMRSEIPNPKNVIKDQFCGAYAYVTRCTNCETASERMSEFYELDLNIQGNKTLEDALKRFLEVEKLEGENQYMCSNCNGKQNATRAIELKTLPPVLNLQLLRFVFDLKTGSKKKLNSCIQFPEVLDMSAYLPKNQSAMYDLSAVLIHRGQSAYSGHYVAHIKGKDNQAWYKFNDEEIEKIKGRNLQLGNEDDLEMKQKKSRTPKGYHASKNAYMLVYTKRTRIQEENRIKSDVLLPLIQVNNEVNICTEKQKTELAETTPCDEKSVQPNNFFHLTNNEKQMVKPTEKEGVVCQSKSENLTVNIPPSQPGVPSSISVPSVLTSAEWRSGSDNTNDNANSSTPNNVKLLPDYIVKYVEKDNALFENWVLEMNEMKQKNIATGREKQETVKSIFQDLVYNKNEPNNYEWFPLQWLSKWLEDPNIAPAVDITPFLCSHGKICPEQSVKMKCVSPKGCDQLYNIYGGNIVKLQGDHSLCEKCVRNKCKLIRTKQRIAEDDKFITAAIKSNVTEERSFWIGKGSYRSWRRLALERLSEEIKSNTKDLESENVPVLQKTEEKTDAIENGSISGEYFDEKRSVDNLNKNYTQDTEVSREKMVREVTSDGELLKSALPEDNGVGFIRTTKSESDIKSSTSGAETIVQEVAAMNDNSDGDVKQVEHDDETLLFNEDILCEKHMGLDPDQSCRKLVPETVWVKLKHYFPGCPEFSNEMPSCEDCQSSREAENERAKLNKQMATAQKATLSDLFHDRKRPTSIHTEFGVNVVSTMFIEAWRQFLRDPVKTDPMSSITNKLLLCSHGGYVFPVPGEGEQLRSDEKVTYVSAEEWSKLKQFYSTDCEIAMLCINENDKYEVVTVPNICDECLLNRLSFEENEIYDYENTTVYVRKQLKLGKAENRNIDNDSSKDDPEFNNQFTTSAKKRNSTSDVDFVEPPEKFMKLSENGKNVRKSQRHRKVRGEKELNVSSKQTLKDLKLQIMKLFSVPPFDQNLYIQGRLLTDNNCSLNALKVAPGSVIDLIADEPNEDPTFLEELNKESGIPESGFKGTNLLST